MHHSQQLIEEREDKSVVIQLHVQQNYEMEREILGFGAGMIVLTPERLRKAIKSHMMEVTMKYE